MRVLICGDYCDRGRVHMAIEEGDTNIIKDIVPYVNNADISILNFEFPIVEGNEVAIPKCGPSLKGYASSIRIIKEAGFSVCTLANNHILDYGGKACLHTKELLEKEGIQTVGADKDEDSAARILYLQRKEKTLAVINCCEHEFSIATSNTAGANPLNIVQQYYRIKEARKNADYVLVIVHGGHELYKLPSPRMIETYHFFVDIGADAVVNHHQHCVSGYEYYKGKPIYYGIGNFLFDHEKWRHDIWNKGMMVELEFNDTGVKDRYIPYSQCDEHPCVNILKGNELNDFKEEVNLLCSIISSKERLEENYNLWLSKSSRYYSMIFYGLIGSIARSLYIRGFLPLKLPKQIKYRIINYINCESHLDKLRYVARNKI